MQSCSYGHTSTYWHTYILKKETYFNNNWGNTGCEEVLSRIQRGNGIGHFHLENTAIDRVSRDEGILLVCLFMLVLSAVHAGAVSSAPHLHDLLVKKTTEPAQPSEDRGTSEFHTEHSHCARHWVRPLIQIASLRIGAPSYPLSLLLRIQRQWSSFWYMVRNADSSLTLPHTPTSFHHAGIFTTSHSSKKCELIR